MLRSDQIITTVEMIQKENLDVRTVTMGINLLDCRGESVQSTCENIKKRINALAGNFVPTCDAISRKYGIPVVNKRISVTPIAFVGVAWRANWVSSLAVDPEERLRTAALARIPRLVSTLANPARRCWGTG